MARSRLLKPDFFEDEKIAALPFGARLLFQSMWCLADREGRLEDRPSRIAAFAFPPMGNERQQANARKDVPAWIELLVGSGMVERYEAEGESYLNIPSWKKHQKIHDHEAKSALPEPMSDIGRHWGTLGDFGKNVAGREEKRNKAEAEAEAGTRARDEAAPLHPFALAYVQHWQQTHAGNAPSPIRHGEIVALEKEHGADRCLQAAAERGWDKPAQYYREWLLDPNNTKEARTNGRAKAPVFASRGGARSVITNADLDDLERYKRGEID